MVPIAKHEKFREKFTAEKKFQGTKLLGAAVQFSENQVPEKLQEQEENHQRQTSRTPLHQSEMTTLLTQSPEERVNVTTPITNKISNIQMPSEDVGEETIS